jgi:hypothetical protein
MALGHGRASPITKLETSVKLISFSNGSIMKPAIALSSVAIVILFGPFTSSPEAADGQNKIGYRDTPMLPGGQWHVHDSERPQPVAVTPGAPSAPDSQGKAPSDALVLFDGTDLSRWEGLNGGPANWKVENGYMEVLPASGDIQTKQLFGDCQLHVEWATPNPPAGDIMNRGNSGVFLFGQYEIQVFESYPEQRGIYADGQAGAVYGQYPPLVNACRKPGEWQCFDILFTAPRFDGQKLLTPAFVTVLHNGIVVHNHTAILGSTGHRILPQYTPQGPQGPVRLQAHGNPVRYRNIWIRAMKGYDAQ